MSAWLCVEAQARDPDQQQLSSSPDLPVPGWGISLLSVSPPLPEGQVTPLRRLFSKHFP